MSALIERASDGSVRIAVVVQPGASRAEVVGEHGGALKVRVAAAAERGRANEAVVELLAEALGVPRRQIELDAGHTSRRKRFVVRGVDAEAVARRVHELAGG